jgi:c-di-GMP-binding flagellar brake protein YcgR
MNRGNLLDLDSQRSVLEWAAQRQVAITVSLLADQRWCNFRSQLIGFDPQQSLLQIAYPIASAGDVPAEIVPGDQVGISFRRGHKKCVFVSPVIMRRLDAPDDGQPADTLLIRAPQQLRELQRRAYQRIDLPPDHFIAVKVWQGGLPSPGEPCWPICSGRVGNISVGGTLVDVRADQNPRLGVGDAVGLEITVAQGHPPLMAEAQYRHCTMTGPDRVGLGLQFLGLEHDLPGRSSITEIADFVRGLQCSAARQGT